MQITIREPGSAITHFIGMMMAVFAAVPSRQGFHPAEATLQPWPYL